MVRVVGSGACHMEDEDEEEAQWPSLFSLKQGVKFSLCGLTSCDAFSLPVVDFGCSTNIFGAVSYGTLK